MTKKLSDQIHHAFQAAKDAVSEATDHHTPLDRAEELFEKKLDIGLGKVHKLADNVLGSEGRKEAHEFLRDLRSDLKDLVSDAKDVLEDKPAKEESSLDGILGRIHDAWENLWGG